MTAKAYVNYIRLNLDSAGLFFSINAPSKWNVKKYSDYNYHTLKCIDSKLHRLYNPSGAAATTPVFNTFKLREQGDKHLDVNDVALMDAIGDLQTLGLGRLLEAASEGYLSITDPDDGTLELLRKEIETNATLKEKMTLLSLASDININKNKSFSRLVSLPYFCYYSDALIVALGRSFKLDFESNCLYSYVRSYYGIPKEMPQVISKAFRFSANFARNLLPSGL